MTMIVLREVDIIRVDQLVDGLFFCERSNDNRIRLTKLKFRKSRVFFYQKSEIYQEIFFNESG